MSRMCWGCGYDVLDNEDECPNCGDKVPSGKCPFCGEDMYPSYHHICRHCGRDDRPWMRPENLQHTEEKAIVKQEEQKVHSEPFRKHDETSDTSNAKDAQKQDGNKPRNSRKDWCMNLSFLLSFVVMVGVFIKILLNVRGDDVGFVVFVGIAVILLILLILSTLFRQYDKTKKIPIMYVILTALLYWGVFMIADNAYQFETNKEKAYNQGIAYAQQKQWDKAEDTLMPYFHSDNKIWDLVMYVSNASKWSEKKYDIASLDDDTISKLPTVLQADAKALQKQEDAYTNYSWLKKGLVFKPELKIKKDTYPSTLIKQYLVKYNDADLPEEFQADSAKLRQFVLEQAEIEKENPEYFREPIEVKTPVFSHSFSKNTPKSQKAKDEEDYSRGYDDGRFSAAEGIWEDYDENESEAYINGYQDGQGEAREEMEEERQRQNKPSK